MTSRDERFAVAWLDRKRQNVPTPGSASARFVDIGDCQSLLVGREINLILLDYARVGPL